MLHPGTRYVSRIRSNKSQPIQDIFGQINDRLNGVLEQHPDKEGRCCMARRKHAIY